MNNISKNIHLCYKDKNVPKYVIDNLLKLNPNYNICLSDDEDCKNFLYKNFSQQHVDCFEFIPHGPIKADFWRVCKLYIDGGIYCDIDIEPLVPFDSFFESDAIFVTSSSKIRNYLNPIILAAHKHDPILEHCIDIYINKKFPKKNRYRYWDWSICPIMHRAFCVLFRIRVFNQPVFHKIIHNNLLYQFLNESVSHHRNKMCTLYNNISVCNNHYSGYKSRSHDEGFINEL
jgi:hypothetical protein